MGFGLCRLKMMNGIVVFYLLLMWKDVVEKNGILFCFVGCVGFCIISEFFIFKFKYVGVKCYFVLLLCSNRSLFMLFWWCFFVFFLFWIGVLVDMGRE